MMGVPVVVIASRPPVDNPSRVKGLTKGEWRPEVIGHRLGNEYHRDLHEDMVPVPLEYV